MSGAGPGSLPGFAQISEGASQEYPDGEPARTYLRGGTPPTKVIPRFPTETACLKLVFATLLMASQRWRGLRVTPRILRELNRVRKDLYPLQGQVA